MSWLRCTISSPKNWEVGVGRQGKALASLIGEHWGVGARRVLDARVGEFIDGINGRPRPLVVQQARRCMCDRRSTEE